MSKYKNFRLFNDKISFLIDKKAATTFIILLIAAFIVFVISTGTGEMKINPLTVVQVLFGGGPEMEKLIITSFRLPRIIVALMVGISLAVAGGILQGMIRNPLASPDVLGITGGAAVAVVGFLAFFSDKNNALTVSIAWLPLAAFLGAGIVAFFSVHPCLEKWSIAYTSCFNRDWDIHFDASTNDIDDDHGADLSGKSGKHMDYRYGLRL